MHYRKRWKWEKMQKEMRCGRKLTAIIYGLIGGELGNFIFQKRDDLKKIGIFLGLVQKHKKNLAEYIEAASIYDDKKNINWQW